MSRMFEERFGVLAEDGARSGAFLVWVPRKKNELYIASRSIGGLIKGTIHLDGIGASPRHFGFTTEAVAALTKRSAPLNRSRHLVEFPGLQIAPGVSIECRICIPHSGLRVVPAPKGAEKVTWVPAAPAGFMLDFYLVIAPENCVVDLEKDREAGTHYLGEGRLLDGRRVFVVFRVTSEDEIASAMNDLAMTFRADGAKLAANRQSYRILACDVHPKGYLVIADLAADGVMPTSEDGTESLGRRGRAWPKPVGTN